MKIRNIFPGIFLLVTFALHANSPVYNGICKFNIYMRGFDDCLDKELTMYDKELNKIYRRLVKNGDNDLKKTEVLWIKFKEADCHYMSKEVNGGSYYNVIYKACLINKTKSRVEELKRSFLFFGWFEKDF